MAGSSSKNKGASLEKEKPSSILSEPPSIKFEIVAGYPTLLVAGVDEVGRGCLAGPVVAGAVILPYGLVSTPRKGKSFEGAPEWVHEISDSKMVKAERREVLFPLIQEWVMAWGIGVASVEEIDSINIFHASHLAMVRAIAALKVQPEHVLIDGNMLPKKLTTPGTAIVKGDMKCLSIAAASILAKVYRDRLMGALDLVHPGFDFAQHKGYGTPKHYEALRAQGPSPIHRRSFAPIAEMLGLVEKAE